MSKGSPGKRRKKVKKQATTPPWVPIEAMPAAEAAKCRVKGRRIEGKTGRTPVFHKIPGEEI